MATKEHKRQAQGVIGALEFRVHSGPPIHEMELHAAREFLRQRDFPPASEYFRRLAQIQDRLRGRSLTERPQGKRNYGGEAAGFLMQLQSIYDHVIFSTCYDGEFRGRRGRIKLSHRFNQEGRIDFIEMKYLRSLHPVLDGEVRKLIMVKDYRSIHRGWHSSHAFVLPALPQELIFLYGDIFRCPRPEIAAWLVNIGHGMMGDLLKDIGTRPAGLRENGRHLVEAHATPPQLEWVSSSMGTDRLEMADRYSNGKGKEEGWYGAGPQVHSERANGDGTSANGRRADQLPLEQILVDEVAMPILRKAAALECAAEHVDAKTVLLRYFRATPC